MKPVLLRVFVFLLILPFCVTYAQFNPKQFKLIHKLSNKFNTKEYLIRHSDQTINNIRNFPPLIDSIVNICQPPWNNQKLIINYDNFGRLNNYIEYTGDQLLWNISDRYSYYYDSLGNMSCILDEIYLNQWSPSFKTTYTYDQKWNIVSEIEEVYSDSNWVNLWKYLYQYNISGKLEKENWFDWDGSNWVNDQQVTYFYNNGFRDSIYFEGWVDSQWLSKFAFKPHYNNQGYLTSVLWKSWSNNQWVNYLSGTINYDTFGNQISGLIECWDGNQWINDSRYFYDYNSDNYFAHGRNEIWQNGIWIIGDGEMDFDGFNRAFIGSDLSVYYKITSSIDNMVVKMKGYNLYQNFPNPFNPATTIKFTIPTDGLVKLQVYDILGKEVVTLINEYRHKGDYEIEFDAGNLSSGIYIYKIHSGSFIQSKKMVLQK